jgi:Glycosyl transferases group 1
MVQFNSPGPRNNPAWAPPGPGDTNGRICDPLPRGGCFDCLNVLLRFQTAIRDALLPDSQDDGASGEAWFRRIDRLVREPPDSERLATVTRAMKGLRDGPHWPDLIAAVINDAQQATRLRRTQGRLRSLWGVTPIVSLKTLVAADRRLGTEAESLVFTTYYITRDFDLILSEHVAAIQEFAPETLEAFCLLVLLWALFAYDVFFFYNDRGILPADAFTGRYFMGIRQEELNLIRKAGKLLYTLPYGADYRTREASMRGRRFSICMDCPEIGKFCFCNAEAWPIVFHTISAYATAMLSAGLAIEQLPGSRRLDFMAVDTEALKPTYAEIQSDGKLRVLHVPNHPHFKGTRYLESAVKKVKEAGFAIDFRLASGLANNEILELIRHSDVVIDQLISGNFGLTALEAMALGKPVIVHIANPSILVAPNESPFIEADPESIYHVLLDLARGPAQLNAIGRRSRRYVETHHSIPALSMRLAELYEETAGIRLRPRPRQAGD